MALNSKEATVLTTYEANTKPHEKAVKSLTREEKKRVDELVKNNEKAGASLEDIVLKYGKVAAGVAAVGAAYDAATAAVEKSIERQKLAAASAGADIDALQKSANGLISELDAMRFAADAMNGTFKLSQKEMETATRAALAFEAQGKDLKVALERIAQATREGSVEPLKELGVTIAGVPGGTQEGLNAVMEALNDQASSLGSNFKAAGQDIRQSATEFQDAKDRLGDSFGKLVQDLAPLVNLLTTFVNLLSDVLSKAQEINDAVTGKGFLKDVEAADAAADRAFRNLQSENEAANAAALAGGMSDPAFEAAFKKAIGGSLLPTSDDDIEFLPANQNRKKGGRSRLAKTSLDDIKFGDDDELDAAIQQLIAKGAQQDEMKRIRDADQKFLKDAKRDIREYGDVARDALSKPVAEIAKLEFGKQQTLIEQLFGTPAEIDAAKMAIGALGGVMDGFVGAFGAGFDALITGSSSFAEAFQDAVAQTARSLAVEFGMQALRHSLFGLGSLAFGLFTGNPAHFASATAHAKAAAGFAAGAAGLGGGARALGAGQGAAAPSTLGTSGVGSASPGGGSVGNGNRSTVFLLDDSFTDRPAGEREAIWRKKARRAGVTFEGDAVING